MQRLQLWWGRLLGSARDWQREIPAPPQLRSMLLRELQRSERTATEFAILTVGYGPAGGDRRSLARLARLLKPRLRSSDGLGWMDSETACAILSSTSEREAQQVAEKFLESLPDDVGRPVCKVLSFPADRAEIEALTQLPESVEETVRDRRGGAWRRWLGARARRASAQLPSPRNFLRLLERQRSRADRAAEEFSLVSWEIPGASRRTMAEFAEQLVPRLRGTDAPGWLDHRRVAVALPDTNAHGAWTFARQLASTSPTLMGPTRCEVYSYPSNWLASTTPWDQARLELEDGSLVRPLEVHFVKPLPRWKRALDLFGVLVGGTLLLPLLAVVALAVKWTSPGPILFVQPRTGRGGKRFMMYKFRSMVTNAEALKQTLAAQNEQDGPAFKITNDPRITPLGRFIRKTSIDELPQLWNVLRGEMSLVGPRPLPCAEQDACHGWYRRRLEITPGLTCIWQAGGGGVGVSFQEWMRMDARYAKARSFIHDFQLIFKTAWRVVLRKASR